MSVKILISDVAFAICLYNKIIYCSKHFSSICARYKIPFFIDENSYTTNFIAYIHAFSGQSFVDIKGLTPHVMNTNEHCTWTLDMPVKYFYVSVFPEIHLKWKVDTCLFASPACFKWFRIWKEMLNTSWKSFWGLKVADVRLALL